MQRCQWTAGSHNRAGDHESEHGADGAAGEDKVHQLRRSDPRLLRAERNDRGVDGAGEEAQGQNKPRHMLRGTIDKQVHQHRREPGEDG